ncbi:hypothetical protein BD779DRAFT_1479053 [Infundibulicybe gibba]|nr:hypothetical protein BD779DRAFT_1479053 [Infundibulicybe gibba]
MTMMTEKKFARLKRWRNIVTYFKSKEYTIKEGMEIFVKPEKSQITDRTEEAAHQFWKARILELRGESPPWMKVQWYYSPSDILALVGTPQSLQIYKRLGNTELVLSNMTDIILVACYVGWGIDVKMRFGGNQAFQRSGNIWRKDQTRRLVLSDGVEWWGDQGEWKFRLPQIVAVKCTMRIWTGNDIAIVVAGGREGEETRGLLGFSKMPYIRGYGGYEETGDWQIVGSGMIKTEAMRLIEEGGEMSGLWTELVELADEGVIMGMVGKRWQIFYCPVCKDVEI